MRLCSMCSISGPANLGVDELKWYKYRCTQCGHVYKSTGKKSVCPTRRYEDGEKVQGSSHGFRKRRVSAY